MIYSSPQNSLLLSCFKPISPSFIFGTQIKIFFYIFIIFVHPIKAKQILEKFQKEELQTIQKEGKKNTMWDRFSEVVNQDQSIM